jgi:VWFA-related protein
MHVPCCLRTPFAFLFLTAALHAQTPNQQPAAADSPLHMDVAVTTGNGDPVAGLAAADFTLLEDKKPQPIERVQAMTAESAPTEGILLIDDVNATFTTVGNERQQIDRFLRSNEGRLPFPLRLAVMSDAGTQMGTSVTADGNALAAQLDQTEIGLREVRRSAGFYGAVERFELSMKTVDGLIGVTAGMPGRKVILWVSPGWPSLSGPGVMLSEAQEKGVYAQIVGISTALRKQDVVIYHVNPLGVQEDISAQTYYEAFLSPVRRPGDAQYGDLNLQVFATQSGGLVLTSNDIAGMLARCVKDAASFYRITFQALPGDGKSSFHSVQVTVDKPGAVARTRSGYYVEP